MRLSALLLMLGLLLAGCTEPAPAPETGGADDADAGTQGGAGGDATDPTGTGTAGDAGNGTDEPDGDAAEPPLFSGTFHLHAEDGHLWMDARPTPEGTVSGSNVPGTPNTYHRFVLEPAVGEDHRFGQSALVKVHWSVQQGVNADMEAGARLVVAGVAYEALATEHGLRVALPDGVAAGDEVALEVCVCGSDAAASNYVIDLDERTWVRFD